jgi:hypothetical protein
MTVNCSVPISYLIRRRPKDGISSSDGRSYLVVCQTSLNQFKVTREGSAERTVCFGVTVTVELGGRGEEGSSEPDGVALTLVRDDVHIHSRTLQVTITASVK